MIFITIIICDKNCYNPLSCRGRLKHGRHFTFKSTLNESAVTLVSPSVAGAIVDSEHRYATHGLWLQVLLNDEFIDQLCHQLEFLNDITQVRKIIYTSKHISMYVCSMYISVHTNTCLSPPSPPNHAPGQK